MMKAALLLCALAGVSVCQEFTVSTPKGNLIVNVTSTRREAVSFFTMQGTITNKTAWDLKFLRLRVTFYDQSGNELSGLCPRRRILRGVWHYRPGSSDGSVQFRSGCRI
jgi:hypothetical protein